MLLYHYWNGTQLTTERIFDLDVLEMREQLARLRQEMQLETTIAKQMALYGQWMTAKQWATKVQKHHVAQASAHVDGIAREIIRQCLAEDVIVYNGVPIYFKPQFLYLDTAVAIVDTSFANIQRCFPDSNFRY